MRIFEGRALHYLLLIAALPLLGYQFGYGNQVEQFSLVRRLVDPTFLRGDFYVDSAAGFGPRYYYSLVVAWLTRLAPLPAVILVLTFLTNLALAAVTFDVAKRHLAVERFAGPLAALVVIVNSSFALGFAGYLRFESFQPANLAIAFALGGFSLLLAEKRLLAAPAFAAAAAMHPLIGVEVAAIAYGAAGLAEIVKHRRPLPILRAWIAYVPSTLLFGAAVFAAWVLPGLGEQTASIPDSEFFHILAELRAPHHYLAREMPNEQFVRAGLFMAALAGLAFLHLKENGLRFAPTALALAAVLVCVLCVASVIFVDLMQLRLFTTAQLFRTLLIVKWVGLLFFAARAAKWLEDGKPLSWVGAVAPVLATGEAQPYVLVATLIVVEGARRLRVGPVVQWVLAGLLALFAIRYLLILGEWKDFGRGVIGAGILVCFFALQQWMAPRLAATGAVGLAIGFGVANRDLGYDFKSDIFEPTYAYRDLRTTSADVARWAEANSPKDSVWITPPTFEAFRLIAQRPIVADFTSLPFQDAAMREWAQRMEALYGKVEGGGFTAQRAMIDNYRIGDPARLEAAARRYGATHAVLYADTPWAGPVLYQNAEYKAVQLSEPAP
jgi:hypothetical protein